MPDEKMTLEERLLNPQWVHGPDPHSDAVLDKHQTLADMQEAAAKIGHLKAMFAEVEKATWQEGAGDLPAYQKCVIRCRKIARDAVA